MLATEHGLCLVYSCTEWARPPLQNIRSKSYSVFSGIYIWVNTYMFPFMRPTDTAVIFLSICGTLLCLGVQLVSGI